MSEEKNVRPNDIPDGYVDIYSSGQRRRYSKKKKSSVIVRNSIIMLLSLIFIISGSGMIYYYKILTSVNVVKPSITSSLNSSKISSTALSDSQTSSEFSVDTIDELINDSNVLNIMLFGEDNRNGAEYGRSDTHFLIAGTGNKHRSANGSGPHSRKESGYPRRTL